MKTETHPLFALYVVWHPSYAAGGEIADLLYKHFGGDRHQGVAGEAGLSVVYRNQVMSGGNAPFPVDWNEAQATAVVVLADSALANDLAWANYVRELARNAEERGLLSQMFPVVMEIESLQLEFEQQALRWDLWNEAHAARKQRLVRDLTHEFCRMLHHRLDVLHRPDLAESFLPRYAGRTQVFISHSKHDRDGEFVARAIRNWLHENSPMSSFFDVHDIPPGASFHDVILDEIKNSAVVVLHTDSYSSREWCRREVIEAKLHQVPMIIVDCLREFDSRNMPYMGNVPVARMSRNQKNRIGIVVGYLLDEVFRSYIWCSRVEGYKKTHPNVLFTACPPELMSLASLPAVVSGSRPMIVSPEPPLDANEDRLFLKIAPDTPILTLAEWLEEI